MDATVYTRSRQETHVSQHSLKSRRMSLDERRLRGRTLRARCPGAPDWRVGVSDTLDPHSPLCFWYIGLPGTEQLPIAGAVQCVHKGSIFADGELETWLHYWTRRAQHFGAERAGDPWEWWRSWEAKNFNPAADLLCEAEQLAYQWQYDAYTSREVGTPPRLRPSNTY